MNLADLNRLERVSIDDSDGSIAVKAAVAGQAVYVVACDLTLASSTTFVFQSDTTDLSGAQTLTAKVLDPIVFASNLVMPWYQTSVGEALNITLGAAVQISGVIFIVQE